MRIGCYVCRCGPGTDGQVSARIDPERLTARLRAADGVDYVTDVELACSEAGQARLAEHLREQRPDRVVFAACSPREHGGTFQNVMREAGLNPYLMQLANVREQVAWVTPDPVQALDKADRTIRAAVARVPHQRALEHEQRPVSTDVLVIGGGPAGHAAALALAEAGRHVTIVERSPILGGVPVRIEDLYPGMDCAPCLLEPLTGSVLHGDLPGPIDVLLLAEVVALKGSLGNFTATVRRRPRYVTADCVGCGECVTACPVSVPNPVNLGRTGRKAVDFEIFGGLPSIPVLDPAACTRFTAGADADTQADADAGCTACRAACPIDDVIDFDDRETVEERTVGAVVVAVGADGYDPALLPGLAHGRHPDVLSAWEFERLLAANGPTAGRLLTHDGRVPRRVAVVNCAGSLEDDHVPYCSGTCCQVAFKFHHLITEQEPGTEVVVYYKPLVAPGKEAAASLAHARRHEGTRWVRYDTLDQLSVQVAADGADWPLQVTAAAPDGAGPPVTLDADLVVLMTPVVPNRGLAALADVLHVALDGAGFLKERNSQSTATGTTTRGIVMAGTCQSPMSLAAAMTQGTAAAGQVLATLVEGRMLTLEAVTASVDTGRCSGCLSCLLVCPYTAIDRVADPAGGPGTVSVDPALCTGCGTCVATCPSGAMLAAHFTDDAVTAEILEALR